MRFELEKDSLKKGTATRKLFDLIPIENIRAYIGIYREMKKTEIKKYTDITPEGEITKIRKSLERLVARGYLTKDSSRHFLGELIKTMAKSDIAMESFISRDMNKEGFPEDRALNFLIYALIYDCKHYTKKYNYELVGDFLDEQGIADLYCEDIGKRYRRLNKDTIKKHLINYLIVSDGLQDAIKDIGTSKEERLQEGFLSQCAFEIVSESKSKTPITI